MTQRQSEYLHLVDTLDLNTKLNLFLEYAIHHVSKQDIFYPRIVWTSRYRDKPNRPIEIMWDFLEALFQAKANDFDLYASQVYNLRDHFESYLKEHNCTSVSHYMADYCQFAVYYVDW
jgi:hypothetical protein